MILYIVTNTKVPSGQAALNRKLSLAKGFQFHGFEVRILSYRVYKPEDSWKAHGNVDGVSYTNMCPRLIMGSKVNKIISLTIGVLKLLQILSRMNDQDRSIVWSNSTNAFVHFPLYVLTRIMKFRYFIELNENPMVFFKSKGSLGALEKKYYLMMLNMFDYVFSMTYTLRDLIRVEVGYGKDIEIVSNAVDLDRFYFQGELEVQNYITYVGSLSVFKDGLDLLLQSYALVHSQFPAVKLRLVGLRNPQEELIVGNLIEELGLSDSIVILYDIPREEIPMILGRSLLLVSTRVSNDQTRYGFPTKLVEYLASGRPVLVTETSDVGMFLSDGVSAYIPKDSSVYSIADKMKQALTDANKDSIGINGRVVAQHHFNPVLESAKMIKVFSMHHIMD